jgi:hypothetical protein
MRKLTAHWYRLAAVAAAVGTLGCKSLEVTNPNAPDAARAFSDPAAVAGLVAGAMHTWYGTRGAYYGPMNLATMAESYTSSWNNAQMRYYNSIGPVGFFQSDCPQRCGWVNSTSDAKRFPIESIYFGMYGMLSSVNDVLTAIRSTTHPLVIGDADNTKLLEAAAVMLEGVVFANIAVNYDKGFYVTEKTDISNPAGLPFRPRAEMRDSAISTFNQAIALFSTAGVPDSPEAWTGVISGISYTPAQWIKLIRTMQAELLVDFPRDAAENATVDWAQVATFASQGLSSGTSEDFNFFQDLTNLADNIKQFGLNGFLRIHTKVANLVTGGYAPALGSVPPMQKVYPGAPEPQPNSADKRVGDGTWGPDDNFNGAATVAEDAGAGTDFAWSPQEVFRPVRGAYHQSSLIHIRYSYLASTGSGLPSENGQGVDPFYPATANDLFWAEGLLRSGGSAATAAALINKTRVGRGGLPALTGGEPLSDLLLALQYEQEVEEIGFSSTAFYNRRRGTPEGWTLAAPCPSINCLYPATPRQMPVPAKELSVLGQAIYTFGGAAAPDFSPSIASGSGMFKPAPQVSGRVFRSGSQRKQ